MSAGALELQAKISVYPCDGQLCSVTQKLAYVVATYITKRATKCRTKRFGTAPPSPYKISILLVIKETSYSEQIFQYPPVLSDLTCPQSGASDFSDTAYSLDDTSGDTNLDDFNIDAAPSYLYSTLADIVSINSYLKIHLVPWSPVRRLMSMSGFSGWHH